MAIAQTTISKSVGWARTDVVLQLEEAFSWLGWHGETQTSSVIGIATTSLGTSIGGGTVGSINTYYPDVRPISSSGIGTGASFYIGRSNGVINTIYVNRIGYGYTGREVVTISAEDIGGAANGATNVQFNVVVPGTVAGAIGYAITFVEGSNYNASGTDRNGVVSGVNTTITIREGDTLTLANFNITSSYQVNICWKNDSTANNTNRVFNVINQNANTNGGICTWTPAPGQAGVYFIKEDGFSGLTTTTVVVTPANSSDITYTGIGSTSTFYFKDITPGSTTPYGILRHQIQANKRFGDTYRGFQVADDYRMAFYVGSGFNPITNFASAINNESYVLSTATQSRFTGTQFLDTTSLYPNDNTVNKSYLTRSASASQINYAQTVTPTGTIGGDKYRYATSSTPTSHNLNLNIYRSGIDPKFVVFSYSQPSIASSKISDNVFLTFILHNFESNLWDYDNVFLGGITFILPQTSGSGSGGSIDFRTILNGNSNNTSGTDTGITGISRRTAEFGYATYFANQLNMNNDGGNTMADCTYQSTSTLYSNTPANNFGYGSVADSPSKIYTRYNDLKSQTSISDVPTQSVSGNFNAVIKGIPLNGRLIPCPYYLPDDFVLIDFKYNVSATNIKQGDTITISGSEVYTVINGSYNQSNETAGLLFCARTV